MDSPGRRTLPVVFFVIAALVAVVGILFTASFLREYGDTNASGALQGLRSAVLPTAVVAGLAIAAAFALRTRVGAVVAGALVVAALVGPTLAGHVAVSARYAALPRTAPCVMDDPADKGSMDPAAAEVSRRVQEAFDALKHPSPFVGDSATGLDGCTVTLATDDLAAALAFYRTELPAKDWAVTEDGTDTLVATREDLVLTVDGRAGEDDRLPQVTIAPVR